VRDNSKTNNFRCYWYSAWQQSWSRQANAINQRVTSTCAPSGEDLSARRYLQRGWIWGVVRLAVRVNRQTVWKLAAPNGTCPPPGDFAAATLVCWNCMRDLQAFWWSFKGGIAGVPWVVARDRGLKHVVFLELWLGIASFELWLGMADEHEELLSCGSGWRVLSM